MKGKTALFFLFWVAAGCEPSRIYVPVTVLMPPDPPGPSGGTWVGAEAGKVPAQFPGESGSGLAVYGSGVYLSRFSGVDLRTETVGSLWVGSYRYDYPERAIFRTMPFVSPMVFSRGSLLLPIGTMCLEAGLGAGILFQLGVPEGVYLIPFSPAGGIHVGMGLPEKFWFRAAWGGANTGFALSVALSDQWWAGGSFVRWRVEPRDWGLRLTLVRRLNRGPFGPLVGRGKFRAVVGKPPGLGPPAHLGATVEPMKSMHQEHFSLRMMENPRLSEVDHGACGACARDSDHA